MPVSLVYVNSDDLISPNMRLDSRIHKLRAIKKCSDFHGILNEYGLKFDRVLKFAIGL